MENNYITIITPPDIVLTNDRYKFLLIGDKKFQNNVIDEMFLSWPLEKTTIYCCEDIYNELQWLYAIDNIIEQKLIYLDTKETYLFYDTNSVTICDDDNFRLLLSQKNENITDNLKSSLKILENKIKGKIYE